MASAPAAPLLRLFGVEWPIIQAPMAGVATPALAAAVSNAGGLGSLALGSSTVDQARQMIAAFRKRSNRPLNVNLFCHRPAQTDDPRQHAWIERLRPEFARLGASPPSSLAEQYRSFLHDDAMLRLLLEERPTVASFHFGVPWPAHVRLLREAGIVLIASATTLEEAEAVAGAGLHAVVAQGYEAGGHRGLFDPARADSCLGTIALTRLLADRLSIPVIAAGGIMDGAGIAAVMSLGAAAAQLGTAFIAATESSADPEYRAALASDAAHRTVIVRGISGRPARGLANRLTSLVASAPDHEVPDYPLTYTAAKALAAAARAQGETGYAAHWAGQGAPLARALPAADLIATLVREWRTAGSEPPRPMSQGRT